jgi:hypothetical protein
MRWFEVSTFDRAWLVIVALELLWVGWACGGFDWFCRRNGDDS